MAHGPSIFILSRGTFVIARGIFSCGLRTLAAAYDWTWAPCLGSSRSLPWTTGEVPWRKFSRPYAFCWFCIARLEAESLLFGFPRLVPWECSSLGAFYQSQSHASSLLVLVSCLPRFILPVHGGVCRELTRGGQRGVCRALEIHLDQLRDLQVRHAKGIHGWTSWWSLQSGL